MDFTKFLDENFDAKVWVNDAFKNEIQGSKKDQHASTLVMKLQMYIQEVSNVLDENCEEALSSLANVSRQLEIVTREASVLKENMRDIKADIEKVEKDTSASMHQVVHLDTVKNRMLEVKSALQQADNWTTLSSEVDTAFESNNLLLINEKLAGMQTSLDVLTDVPDYKQRISRLEALKNRLEASLSTQIVSAFSTQNIDASQNFLKIFTDIRRLPQLLKYYTQTHKSEILKNWKTLNEKSDTDDNFHSNLSNFYDDLLTLLHSQIAWCKQVFPEPYIIVISLLKEILQSLDPKIFNLIEVYLKKSKRSSIDELKEFKEMSERFHKGIVNVMPTIVLDNERFQEFINEIYIPFKPFVKNFEKYLSIEFERKLEDIKLDGDDILETAKILSDSVNHFFQISDRSLEACMKFSNGAAVSGFTVAFEKFVSEYCKQWDRVLTNVREKCHLTDIVPAEMQNVLDDDAFQVFQLCLDIAHASSESATRINDLEMNLIASYSNDQMPLSPRRHSSQSSITASTNLLSLMCDEEQLKKLKLFESRLNSGESILRFVTDQIQKVIQSAHKLALDVVLKPLRDQIKNIPKMNVWNSATVGASLDPSLPEFSCSPQEFVTKIGQYLLTIPQQLDSVAAQPSACIGLRYANLPYVECITPESSDAASDIWLESIVKTLVNEFIDQVLFIKKLSNSGGKQLKIDIEYLTAVADDLGLSASTTLLRQVAKLAVENEENVAQLSDDVPQRIYSAMCRMRQDLKTIR